MAVATEHQVNRVAGPEEVEHVGRMGEQDCEPTFDPRRNAPGIGAVGCRVVEADDAQFAGSHGDEDRLVDEQVHLVAVG